MVHFRNDNDFTGPLPDTSLNWVTEYSNISATSRWILFNNLKAAAAYQFRVSAENSVGEGPSSEPSNVVLLPQERTYIYTTILFLAVKPVQMHNKPQYQ